MKHRPGSFVEIIWGDWDWTTVRLIGSVKKTTNLSTAKNGVEHLKYSESKP